MLDKKYAELSLTDEYMTDPLLMAMAWKKSHAYIRTSNWYADNFELDLSALDLYDLCNKWANKINTTKLRFKRLKLVPAPKKCEWQFKGTEGSPQIWEPKKKNESNGKMSGVKLRPLAHIPIREQTLMTLVMMCLANKVETQQGDPSTDYEEVHTKRISSYGNRLYCKYIDGKAEYNYGATVTYSKYFTDYRKFLERPYYFAYQELGAISTDEHIYLIELDLEKFFDKINRNILLSKINILMENKNNIASPNKVLTAFSNWKWTKTANKEFKELCAENNEDAPNGLPQGLVAAGFLSNIYLLEFDEDIREQIGKNIDEKNTIKLIDYCRYVDDIRLVIVAPKTFGDGSDRLFVIKKSITKFFNDVLDAIELNVGEEKTKIEIFRGKISGISKDLTEIQARLSGPISFDDANDQLEHLESLLTMTQSNIAVLNETDKKKTRQNERNDITSGDMLKEPKINNASEITKRFYDIENSRFDVREDTLKRFSANKICKILNEIRHFTSQDVDSSGNPKPGSWDYLQERMARRFIACWSQDPSLILLLKKAFELFPSPKILVPVIEQLDVVLDGSCPKQSAVARYCIAEIYRHAATVIHKRDTYSIPAQANVSGFFEYLQSHAVQRINKNIELLKNDFDFLVEQANFLLLVRLDTVLEKINPNPRYDLIYKIISGFRSITIDKNINKRDIPVCILLAYQIAGPTNSLIQSLASLFDSIDIRKRTLKNIILKLLEQSPDLCRLIFSHAKLLKYKWLVGLEKLFSDSEPLKASLDEINSKLYPLFRIISRKDNPFEYEVMALKLMSALLEKRVELSSDTRKTIDITKTKIKFDHFSYPPNAKATDRHNKIDVEIELEKPSNNFASFLVKDNVDLAVLRMIAMCVRSAILGKKDWTQFGTVITPKLGYRGIKTSLSKRKIGLYTTPESIAGERAAFSSWLSTLISKLLIWPGVSVNDQSYEWPKVWTIESVAKIVKQRLVYLADNYCVLSAIPGLTERIKLDWPNTKQNLLVAMVQSKIPSKNDFSKDLLLTDPHYRVKHRRHIASVAKLVLMHIQNQNSNNDDMAKKFTNIDLIIWPELAVHQDDIDILIALSRKTNAIIFSGLTFIQQPEIAGPNNCAVWIVPKKSGGNQPEFIRLQGKHHLMADEIASIKPWRPYQLMLELIHPQFPNDKGFVLTGSICYDATDIALNADLRDKSNAYIVSALNQDVNTFDTMVDALHYHMYQHVVLVNSGEFGGSIAKAPYKEAHKRLIAHVHGNNQVSINTFEMNMFDFRRDNIGKSMHSGLDKKTAPAGVMKK